MADLTNVKLVSVDLLKGQYTTDLKTWVGSQVSTAVADSIKTVGLNGKKLNFYTEDTVEATTTPAFSVDLFSGNAGDVAIADAAGLITATTVEGALAELAAAVGGVDYSGKADKVASATAGNFAGLDADGNLTDSGKKAADFEVAGAAAAVQGETTTTVKALEDLVGSIPEGATATTVAGYAKEITDAHKAAIDSVVSTLVGTDTDKSVRTIAAEELAAKLIPEDAQESLDTLEEIAAWIQAHPGDAATMNAAIQALQTQVGKKADGEQAATGIEKEIADLKLAVGEGGSVADAIQAAITALKLPETYEAIGAADALKDTLGTMAYEAADDYVLYSDIVLAQASDIAGIFA